MFSTFYFPRRDFQTIFRLKMFKKKSCSHLKLHSILKIYINFQLVYVQNSINFEKGVLEFRKKYNFLKFLVQLFDK